MPTPLSLVQAQSNDYRELLTATEALLAGDLAEADVAAYLALRDRCLTAISAREPTLIDALNHPAGKRLNAAVDSYRELLEASVAAEGRLLTAAETCRGELGDQLRAIGKGNRALSGYRSPQRSGEARAISQRV